jgi:hypothetical protein
MDISLPCRTHALSYHHAPKAPPAGHPGRPVGFNIFQNYTVLDLVILFLYSRPVLINLCFIHSESVSQEQEPCTTPYEACDFTQRMAWDPRL